MTVRYFAANVHNDQVIILAGPFPSYDEAMRVHADQLARRRGWGLTTEYWTPTALLDTASLGDLDEPSFAAVLNTDPALHAIFKTGVAEGRTRHDRSSAPGAEH